MRKLKQVKIHNRRISINPIDIDINKKPIHFIKLFPVTEEVIDISDSLITIPIEL